MLSMFICIYPLVEFYTLQISLIECSIICNQPAHQKAQPYGWAFFVRAKGISDFSTPVSGAGAPSHRSNIGEYD